MTEQTETFGDETEDQAERPIKIMLPLKPLNLIEQELSGRFIEELSTRDVPVPFVDDDGSLENADDYIPCFGRPLNLDEAMTIRGLIEDDLLEKYRRQLIIARELGPKATLADYLLGCDAEQIIPLIKGTIK